ncbi:MAG: prepilin-type N-terminal cleavage/methylation domain-containing protein [Patescibacteria group bacterium]|jgi:Tfp pilus assembly protein PilV
MPLDYNRQKGFGLIIILIAILIIAVIALGAMNRKGQIEQNKEVKNKAVEDLKNININLEKNNQEIQNNIK